ncbi:unnamed protein product [Mortierella alpina]
MSYKSLYYDSTLAVFSSKARVSSFYENAGHYSDSVPSLRSTKGRPTSTIKEPIYRRSLLQDHHSDLSTHWNEYTASRIARQLLFCVQEPEGWSNTATKKKKDNAPVF